MPYGKVFASKNHCLATTRRSHQFDCSQNQQPATLLPILTVGVCTHRRKSEEHKTRQTQQTQNLAHKKASDLWLFVLLKQRCAYNNCGYTTPPTTTNDWFISSVCVSALRTRRKQRFRNLKQVLLNQRNHPFRSVSRPSITSSDTHPQNDVGSLCVWYTCQALGELFATSAMLLLSFCACA